MIANEPDRLELADLPTPLIPLDRLSGELDGADLWLKRDDLTGLELSGNKIRKLEYIVADMLAAGQTALVTEGTCQSNHCRATAAVCARLGVHCTLLLRPEPPALLQGNHLLDALFGAETRTYTREQFSAERDAIVAQTLDDLRHSEYEPRFTPMGASEPLGCWGYIRMLHELAEQLDEAEIKACDVVTAISSGGTYAGLVLGRWLLNLPQISLWAVPVSDDLVFHRENVARLCRETCVAFDLDVTLDTSLLQFVDGYVGQGYAIPYDEDIRAIKLLSHTEAILLDPVYTGKAFAAFLDGVRAGRFGRERPAVFLHTGGVFSNFAWPEQLSEGVSTNRPR